MGKIRLVVSDIDGVLTDGRVLLHAPYDDSGKKSLCFKDFDAVGMLKDIGIQLCLITGERDEFVDEVVKRFKPLECISGCKDKSAAIYVLSKKTGIQIGDMAYIGDGKYDIPAIKMVGLGMCPHDAIQEVKRVTDIILEVNGGYGCLAAAYTVINEYNEKLE